MKSPIDRDIDKIEMRYRSKLDGNGEVHTFIYKKKYLVKWLDDKEDPCIGYASSNIPEDTCCCDNRVPKKIKEEIMNIFRLGTI